MLSLFALTAAHALDPSSSRIRYELEPDRSRLFVQVRYDRSALMAGHDHVIAATDFDGTVHWDAADPSACDVSIAFPVTALAVDPGNARSWAGLEGTTSDGDKESIAKNMLGKHQLVADRFPKIAFQSTRCEPNDAGATVYGTLSIHGVDAPVVANVRIEADPDGFRARGSFDATHATWGLDPFTALLGSLRNDEALSFGIDVRGTPVD